MLKETVLSRSLRLMFSGGVALGVTLLAQPAIAQDATPAAQEAPVARVEVTGSRIRQVDIETAQPIQVMNQEQIQKSGMITVGDILNNLSSAGSPDFSKGGSLTSDRENGGQYINLRNLGSNRLLVLVNGKRWTQTVNGYTDLSTIPSAMIDRIEVLKDGASSIYGSDAIAGVVNIILKKSLDGGHLSLYTGQNAKADGKSRDFSLSYGASNDKASLMFGLSHTEQGVIWPGTRAITATAAGPGHPNVGLGTSPWGRIAPVNPDGSANEPAYDEDGNLLNPGSFSKILNHTGGPMGDGTGSDSRNPANYHDYKGAPADRFNAANQMMFQMPNKLDTLFTKGSLELPKDMRLTTTAMFSQRASTAQIAGMPLSSDVQSTFPVYIDKDSYFNPYGNQVAGAGNGQDLFFYRRTIERPRVTENDSRTVHIDATLEGNFTLRDLAWNWSAGYNHSSVTGSVVSTGNLNLLNLKKALGPSFKNASGQIQCGTPAHPIPASECVAWDILGGPSASSQAALDYVMSTGQASYGSTVNSATADISGELYQLPAGALGIAAGLEHRDVSGYDRPGQFEQSGYSSDLAGNPTTGRYTVKEAYLELNVPVLKNAPLAQMLSFDLATRHSDYSNFGTTNNSKASFMWKPIKDLLARGTYAQGFRAPTVGDNFGGGQQSYDEYLDPCDSKFGEASRNPAVAARCLAAGVPANFRQFDQAHLPITSADGAPGAYPFDSGAGNGSLTPETAVTRTLGLVYSPSYLPGLSGSLDWYSIKVDNRITGVSATDVANGCFINGSASFCNAIKRNPLTGEIINLAHGNANMGQLSTEGWDLALTYKLPRTRYGQFSIHNETSYVSSFKEKNDATSDWIDHAGEYFYNRVKSNTALDWNLGHWSATWATRYASPVKDGCFDATAGIEFNIPNAKTSWGTGANELGALVYHDVNVAYKTSWKGQIMVGINNVFDKKPRITYSSQTSSSSVDADLPIDRFFYVRYNQAF